MLIPCSTLKSNLCFITLSPNSKTTSQNGSKSLMETQPSSMEGLLSTIWVIFLKVVQWVRKELHWKIKIKTTYMDWQLCFEIVFEENPSEDTGEKSFHLGPKNINNTNICSLVIYYNPLKPEINRPNICFLIMPPFIMLGEHETGQPLTFHESVLVTNPPKLPDSIPTNTINNVEEDNNNEHKSKRKRDSNDSD